MIFTIISSLCWWLDPAVEHPKCGGAPHSMGFLHAHWTSTEDYLRELGGGRVWHVACGHFPNTCLFHCSKVQGPDSSPMHGSATVMICFCLGLTTAPLAILFRWPVDLILGFYITMLCYIRGINPCSNMLIPDSLSYIQTVWQSLTNILVHLPVSTVSPVAWTFW